MGQMLWANYNPQNDNPAFNYLAQFDPSRPQTPTGGVFYYITSPRRLDTVAQDPVTRCGLYVFLTNVLLLFLEDCGLNLGGFLQNRPQKIF